jgi:sulfoxide reductase heme-binding subunit YedZ
LDQHFYWYMARSSGIVAFWLLTLSTALGLSTSSRLWDGLLERGWVFETHRVVSLMALIFVALHMAVLLPDPWTDFGVVDLVVPGTSAYRPEAVALGVLAMYAGIIATASFYLRTRLGRLTWRALHFVTFGTFVLMLLHGVFAGTDSEEPWMRASFAAATLLILFLTVYRILVVWESGPAPSTPRLAGGGPQDSR